MSNQKNNPKQDWGFYACTPRIVRTQYKDLSHTEKWLYVCLKDLCGDKGVCYRTLKVLAQETDLSTGNLSTGIRRLHEAGLIHAEKKRRSLNPTAKEVWHISIVDIWQSNVEYCSNFEHCEENVQEMNVNVQILNNPPLERSNFEQQRSKFDDRRITPEEQHIEERTVEEGEGVFASAPTPPAQLPPENEYHFYGTEQQHLLWNCQNWCNVNHGTCEDYVAAIEAGLHDNPTDKVPIVPPGNVTPVTYSQPVYTQGEDNAHPVHYRNHPGAFHPGSDSPASADQSFHQNAQRDHPGAASDQQQCEHNVHHAQTAFGHHVTQGAVNGHLSQPAHPDVAGA